MMRKFWKEMIFGAIALSLTGAASAQSGYQTIRGTQVYTVIDQAAGIATFSNSCGTQRLTQSELQRGAIPDRIIPCPRSNASPPQNQDSGPTVDSRQRCATGATCPSGYLCTSENKCIPYSHERYCGERSYCDEGFACIGGNKCLSVNAARYCGAKKYCQEGFVCEDGANCVSEKSERYCGGRSFCEAGSACIGGNKCLSVNSARYCGSGKYCGEGYVCDGSGGCIPASSERYCGNKSICPAGSACIGGNSCLAINSPRYCGAKKFCEPGYICAGADSCIKDTPIDNASRPLTVADCSCISVVPTGVSSEYNVINKCHTLDVSVLFGGDILNLSPRTDAFTSWVDAGKLGSNAQRKIKSPSNWKVTTIMSILLANDKHNFTCKM